MIYEEVNSMEYGSLVGRGRDACVYEWGEQEVIKLFNASASKSMIEREYSKSSIINKLGVPVPYVREIISLNGKQGIIYEKLIGKTLLSIIKSNPIKIKQWISTLAKTHVLLSNYSTNDLPDIKELIKNSMDEINDKILDRDSKLFIKSYIDTLPCKNNICHVDFHPDNIIKTSDGFKIIDWVNAAKGDSCADAAITVTIFTLCDNPPGTPKIINIMTKMLARYIKNLYFKFYLLYSGNTPEEINKWLLPAAVLRLSYNLPVERTALLKIINSQINNLQRS